MDNMEAEFLELLEAQGMAWITDIILMMMRDERCQMWRILYACCRTLFARPANFYMRALKM